MDVVLTRFAGSLERRKLDGPGLDRFDAGVSVFNTIVWATDGSPNADRALAVAKALAHEHRASLVVVHVVQRFASKHGLAVHADEEIVEAKLNEVVAGLSAEGFDATLRIVNHIGPQAAHEIAAVAHDVGADLIVVGTRGYGPIAGLVLGSVTLRLLHVAACPVVAVPAVAGSADAREVDAPHVGS